MTNFEQLQLSTSIKLLAGKGNTDSFRNFYEEKTTSGIHIKPEDILLLYSLLPTEAPDTDTYSVSYKGVVTKIAEKVTLELTASTYDPDVFIDDKLKNVLPHDLGNGYPWTLTDSNGEEIPYGLNQWLIDSYAGTLAFTGGFPSGYSKPLTFTGWRYCGPVGLDNFLMADGSVPLVDTYTPTLDQDISTKKYVDDSVGIAQDLAEKLMPRKPATFENKDLSLINESYPAYRVSDSTLFNRVVYNNDTISIKVPSFYKESEGVINLYINDNLQGTLQMSSLGVGTSKYITISSIEDAYKDSMNGLGFYDVVNMTIDIPTATFISPEKPYADVYLKYVGESEYSSNHIIIGMDKIRTDLAINNVYTDSIENQGYISGVPAITKDSTVNIVFDMATLNTFRQDLIGSATIGDTVFDIIPSSNYNTYYPTIQETIQYQPTSYIYAENFDLTIKSIDSKNNELLSVTKTFNLRIDTSDESTRLDPGLGDYPSAYGSSFDSSANLEESQALQLYHNKYRYPTGDFTTTGSGIYANGKSLVGPNYDNIAEGSYRYALFKLNLPTYCRGFYLLIKNPINTGMDKDSKIFQNLKTNILVSSATGWLDANKPYTSFGNPTQNGDPCLVVAKSSETIRYITFGNKSVKGTIYIRMGIPVRGTSFETVSIASVVE